VGAPAPHGAFQAHVCPKVYGQKVLSSAILLYTYEQKNVTNLTCLNIACCLLRDNSIFNNSWLHSMNKISTSLLYYPGGKASARLIASPVLKLFSQNLLRCNDRTSDTEERSATADTRQTDCRGWLSGDGCHVVEAVLDRESYSRHLSVINN